MADIVSISVERNMDAETSAQYPLTVHVQGPAAHLETVKSHWLHESQFEDAKESVGSDFGGLDQKGNTLSLRFANDDAAFAYVNSLKLAWEDIRKSWHKPKDSDAPWKAFELDGTDNVLKEVKTLATALNAHKPIRLQNEVQAVLDLFHEMPGLHPKLKIDEEWYSSAITLNPSCEFNSKEAAEKFGIQLRDLTETKSPFYKPSSMFDQPASVRVIEDPDTKTFRVSFEIASSPYHWETPDKKGQFDHFQIMKAQSACDNLRTNQSALAELLTANGVDATEFMAPDEGLNAIFAETGIAAPKSKKISAYTLPTTAVKIVDARQFTSAENAALYPFAFTLQGNAADTRSYLKGLKALFDTAPEMERMRQRLGKEFEGFSGSDGKAICFSTADDATAFAFAAREALEDPENHRSVEFFYSADCRPFQIEGLQMAALNARKLAQELSKSKQ